MFLGTMDCDPNVTLQGKIIGCYHTFVLTELLYQGMASCHFVRLA
jgi:hypothetical protein